MISGAAGSTGSIEHAVRGLSEFLMVVLNDEANLGGLEILVDVIAEPSPKSESTQSVLQALRCLPVHQLQNLSEHPTHQMDAVNPCEDMVEKNSDPPNGSRILYACRTKEWIDRTSDNVDKLLAATFPHVCLHSNFLLLLLL